jgi:hypothetical protein
MFRFTYDVVTAEGFAGGIAVRKTNSGDHANDHPCAFRALTLNEYSVLDARPVIMADVLVLKAPS